MKEGTAKRLLLETGMHALASTPAEFKRSATISRTIHWFVESPIDTDVHKVRVAPYLDLLTIEQGDQILFADFIRDSQRTSHKNNRD